MCNAPGRVWGLGLGLNFHEAHALSALSLLQPACALSIYDLGLIGFRV